MSQTKDDAAQDTARTYAEIAARASKLLTEHAERQLRRGIAPPEDELGVAKAFMDMMAKLLSNPYQLAVAQMNLVWDYFSLWQRSVRGNMNKWSNNAKSSSTVTGASSW